MWVRFPLGVPKKPHFLWFFTIFRAKNELPDCLKKVKIATWCGFLNLLTIFWFPHRTKRLYFCLSFHYISLTFLLKNNHLFLTVESFFVLQTLSIIYPWLFLHFATPSTLYCWKIFQKTTTSAILGTKKASRTNPLA